MNLACVFEIFLDTTNLPSKGSDPTVFLQTLGETVSSTMLFLIGYWHHLVFDCLIDGNRALAFVVLFCCCSTVFFPLLGCRKFLST